MCCRTIDAELAQEIAGAVAVYADNGLAGYALGVIRRDEMFGDWGWIDPGGLAVDPEYSDQLFALYKDIGAAWAGAGIVRHHIVVPVDSGCLDPLVNLGFGKQQGHGILPLANLRTGFSGGPDQEFTPRPATSADQAAMSGFSRIIAEFQMKSPCFTSVPESYLKALDEGFASLTEDEDLDLYVIEHKGSIVGYQAFEKIKAEGPLAPPKSVELVVSGIREDFRGTGAGRVLTSYALEKQKQKGYEYAVTDWRCANPLSSKFWQRAGFLPFAERMYRNIS